MMMMMMTTTMKRRTALVMTTMPLIVSSIILFVCCICVEASIQLPDTSTGEKKVYQSRPDREFGLQMRTGLVYPARLQRIAENQHLCDDGKLWNVTIPSDGLPGMKILF
jgi:hypothetical protein